MTHSYWPLFDLRVRTTRLELRPPSDDDLVALARVAAAGVHDPALMPFFIPWTDQASPDLERGVLQWGWRGRAEWKPENWRVGLAVSREGEVIGVQAIAAENFAVTRAVSTGSWLGRAHQGRGIGREMRAAVLHLAFAGLGADVARSGAFEDNSASIAVSRHLGYRENGDDVHVRRGRAAREIRFKLTRDMWEATERTPVEVEGLEPCLEFFGVG
jgi:RimJ/RimL family protein N-acetyltransferase